MTKTKQRRTTKPSRRSRAALGSALATTDASLLNYLEWKELVEMGRNHNHTDFLVLAADGTTCWGASLRMAIKAAMAHDFPEPNTLGQPGGADAQT